MLDIQTRLSKIGNTSGVLRQEIYKKGNGELVADADVTFVIADAKTRKPLNLKDLLKDAMVS